MAKVSALEKVTALAKKKRRENPGKHWRTLMKEAGREIREGKSKRAAPKKSSSTKKKKSRAAKTGKQKQTVAQLKRAASALLEIKLGKLEFEQMKAQGKMAKKKKGKEIQQVRAELKRLI